jgi:hypothetical protein
VTRHNLREQGDGVRGESSDTTSLNPRPREPLNVRMGSIHNSRWSPLATPNNEASWHVAIFRQLHVTHVKLVGATSYPQRMKVAPYHAKYLVFLTCVCKLIHFTVAKWLLVAGKNRVAMSPTLGNAIRIPYKFHGGFT